MKLIKLWEANPQKAYELQNTFEKEENGFMNTAYKLTFDEFLQYINNKHNSSLGIGLKEGYVPDTAYILVNDNDEYVGIFNFRHYLNEALRNGAGHIGYAISKNYRHQGYASKGLSLLINEVKPLLKEDEIYLSVHKDNPSSLKVQLNNNAYIHHEDEVAYYTRIKI